MEGRRQKGVIFVGVAIVAIACLLLIWLAATVLLATGSLGNRIPGREFMLIIGSWSALGLALKGCPPIISLAITWWARSKLRALYWFGMLALCVTGICASVYVLIEIASFDIARRYWAYSPTPGLDSFETFVPAARNSLIAIIIWLVVVVGSQLLIQRKED